MILILLIPEWLVAVIFFFFNETATTEIYTLSLHDALPIFQWLRPSRRGHSRRPKAMLRRVRSEEHTSELQSRVDLVCRLLLEKKKNQLSICLLYSGINHDAIIQTDLVAINQSVQ